MHDRLSIIVPSCEKSLRVSEGRKMQPGVDDFTPPLAQPVRR